MVWGEKGGWTKKKGLKSFSYKARQRTVETERNE